MEMALFEDLFKMKGAAGPTVLGIGALLIIPAVLPAIGRILRPVAKELIKTGVSVYDEARGTVSGAYEAAGDLIAEARSEQENERQPRRLVPRHSDYDSLATSG
jgi:hypothetical protein